MGCNNVVRLGSGRYSSSGSVPPYCWDGHKYACEDDFKEEEPCLVYSFGVFNDASFEEVMAARGITGVLNLISVNKAGPIIGNLISKPKFSSVRKDVFCPVPEYLIALSPRHEIHATF